MGAQERGGVTTWRSERARRRAMVGEVRNAKGLPELHPHVDTHPDQARCVFGRI